jgi:hypothetical protein
MNTYEQHFRVPGCFPCFGTKPCGVAAVDNYGLSVKVKISEDMPDLNAFCFFAGWGGEIESYLPDNRQNHGYYLGKRKRSIC